MPNMFSGWMFDEATCFVFQTWGTSQSHGERTAIGRFHPGELGEYARLAQDDVVASISSADDGQSHTSDDGGQEAAGERQSRWFSSRSRRFDSQSERREFFGSMTEEVVKPIWVQRLSFAFPVGAAQMTCKVVGTIGSVILRQTGTAWCSQNAGRRDRSSSSHYPRRNLAE